MAYRFDLTHRALRDAMEVYEWIARNSPAHAARWYRGLFQRIRTLAESPRRCPVAPENEAFDEEVRQLLYGRRRGVYRILFVIRGDQILILAILHSARQRLGAEQLRRAAEGGTAEGAGDNRAHAHDADPDADRAN